ncbi:MAG: ribonuclease [Firmicutes bacterium]|nr:ribonuclease [Bacillota bacterium]
MNRKLATALAVLLLLAALLTACGPGDLISAVADAEEYLASQEQTQEEAAAEVAEVPTEATDPAAEGTAITEDGWYSDPVSVALYLHTFGHLPDNYLTKAEAERAGWDSGAGNLWDVAPGCSIGGDRFGNREGLLPKASGRKYYECDVNYDGGFRGGERIVYSDDGLIFYSQDHYSSFTQMY